jgi:putative transposase
MEDRYLKETIQEGDIETKIYQFEALSKSIYCAINVVLIVSKNLKTDKTSVTPLFCTDLNLEYKKIMDYYSLRFQIEFNFRDSKQFFGLEDFMNVTKRRVHNFANLSLFMNNVTYLLSKTMKFKEYSINDLKTLFIAEKYAIETLKLYGKNADAILIDEAINQISEFAMIHKRVA